MSEQSSASGKGGGIHSGHLVLLNSSAIYSTLRTSTIDGTWLPHNKKATQMLYTLHHTCKKVKSKWKKLLSVWRKCIKSVYLQGLWWCGLLWTYTHWLLATEFPGIVTATLLEILHCPTHTALQKRITLVSWSYRYRTPHEIVGQGRERQAKGILPRKKAAGFFFFLLDWTNKWDQTAECCYIYEDVWTKDIV